MTRRIWIRPALRPPSSPSAESRWTGPGARGLQALTGSGARGLLVLAALAAAASGSRAQGLECEWGEPCPTDMVRVSRPIIALPFRTLGAVRQPAFEMRVNGEKVEATYDTERLAFCYTPPGPLAPDLYNVSCTVKFEGYRPKTKGWSFIVRDGAPPAPPEPCDLQKRLWEAANGYRRRARLPDLRLDPALCAAAAAHAEYLAANQASDHFETEDLPRYTGRTSRDRAVAFGYIDGCQEDLHCGSVTPEEAVRMLVDAPYHRELLLRPGAVSFGGGFVEDRVVVLVGDPAETEPVVYPADGQPDVPLTWDAPESPDPLAAHPEAKRPVGYVVSFHRSTPGRENIQVTAAALSTEDGEEVPVFVSKLTTDRNLPHGVFLIPKQPLKPQTTYRASITATCPDGRDISRAWSFTTTAAHSQPTVSAESPAAPLAAATTAAAPEPAAEAAADTAPVHRVDLAMAVKRPFTAAEERLTLEIENRLAEGATRLEVLIRDASGQEVSCQWLVLEAGQAVSVALNQRVRSGRVEVRTPDEPLQENAPRFTTDFGAPGGE